jgi:hypothetical protein
MAVDVSAEEVIRRRRDEVAAFVTDPANDPDWIGGVRMARRLDDGPVRVGSRVARVAVFLGRRIEYVNEVVELEPGSRLRMRSVSGPFPMDITYAFGDADGGTRARVEVRGEAARFMRVADPLLGAMVRRSIRRDVRVLRQLLERPD